MLPAMRPVLLLTPVLLLAACAGRGDRLAEATAEEQVLLAQITRDHFVIIASTWRNEDGLLVVETEQGRGKRTYILAPEVDGAKAPLIRRRVDDFALATVPRETDRKPILQRGREP